jgi:hypothetical protein
VTLTLERVEIVRGGRTLLRDVSLALEGGVESGLTADALRERLRELLTSGRRAPRELSRPSYE